MSKVDKKVGKLKEQIAATEQELRVALTKKTHSSPEVSVPALTARIKKLNAELNALTK
jgi:hypothetical protein